MSIDSHRSAIVASLGVLMLVSGCSESAYGLAPGNCTTEPAVGVDHFEVELVSCSEPHALEVYALIDSDPPDDAPFPGHTETFEQYYRLCEPLFPEYVGSPVGGSEYDIYTVYPSRDGWKDGFTEGICLVGRFNSGGELLSSTGSAKASGR